MNSVVCHIVTELNCGGVETRMSIISKVAHDTCSEHQSVVHLLNSLDFGGVESQLANIHNFRSGSRFRHQFVAIQSGGRVAEVIARAGGQVRILHIRAAIPSLRVIWALHDLFRRENPTVVHTHGAEANFHGLIAARLAGVPVRIGEEIGMPGHSWKARTIFRQVYRCAHRVIGVSEEVTKWLIDSGEVPASKALTVLAGIDMPPERGAVFGDDIHLLFVGRLHPIKNPLGLIEAVHLLRARGLPIRATIVGDGPQRADCEALIAQRSLHGFVNLAGFVDRPLHRAWNATLYVQPSLSEGLGLALVEAMACGLPVVAPLAGGAHHFIDDGRTGWLTDTRSPGVIADRIQEVVALGPERLTAVGAAARAAVTQRFSTELYLQQLDELYASIGPLANVGVQPT